MDHNLYMILQMDQSRRSKDQSGRSAKVGDPEFRHEIVQFFERAFQ